MDVNAVRLRSRRSVLLGALATAAAVAATAARPLRAAAATDSVRYVNDTDDETVLSATSAGAGQGIAILGQSVSGRGVEGRSSSGIGVQGVSDAGYGVQGLSTLDNGVYGCSESGIGVHGTSDSTVGVFGVSRVSVGVHGESAGDRGGRFIGQGAQVQLVPADAATHPDSGRPGDLFVDAQTRLWFCRGDAAWVRLA